MLIPVNNMTVCERIQKGCASNFEVSAYNYLVSELYNKLPALKSGISIFGRVIFWVPYYYATVVKQIMFEKGAKYLGEYPGFCITTQTKMVYLEYDTPYEGICNL